MSRPFSSQPISLPRQWVDQRRWVLRLYWDATVRGVDHRMACKRAFDLIVGAPVAIVATPVIFVLAIISCVTYREWPFFTQRRLGRDGQPFTMVKIRTMPSVTNPYALKHDLDPDAVPPVMQTLRQLHLDELPQLWLVPLGTMSLVGPRPRMPDEFEPVPSVYDHVRTRVPQGCTCLWQIGEHTGGLPSEAPEYDLWYLRHGGIRLDLWILFWTALVMVGLAAPKHLHDVPRLFQSRGWLRWDAEAETPTPPAHTPAVVSAEPATGLDTGDDRAGGPLGP